MMPLAAWLASPLAKVGVGLGATALVVGMYYGWKEYQQYIGRTEEREKQNTELLRQAQESAALAVQQAEIKDASIDELSRTNATIQQRLERVQREMDRHEATKTPKTLLDAPTVRIINELASVLNDQSAAQRVPSAGETPREPPVETVSAPSTDGLAKRIKELTQRLAVSEAGWQALSSYDIAQYDAAVKFCLDTFTNPDEGHRYCIGHEPYPAEAVNP